MTWITALKSIDHTQTHTHTHRHTDTQTHRNTDTHTHRHLEQQTIEAQPEGRVQRAVPQDELLRLLRDRNFWGKDERFLPVHHLPVGLLGGL